MADDEDFQILKLTVEQNWQHIRHIEVERLQFTYFYLIVTAATLAYLRGSIYTASSWSFSLFMLILSLLGLVISSKLAAEMKNHIERISAAFDTGKLKGYRQYMAFPKDRGVWKVFKVRYAFLVLYFSMAIVWAYLLLGPA